MCSDCYEAFEPARPWLCKVALANDLWLGRWDPLFRRANLSHQMLLALARIVTTKVVLRPDGQSAAQGQTGDKWDFLFHQSGMVGSAIVFPNASCGESLDSFPPADVSDTFAVSFVNAIQRAPQDSEDRDRGEALGHEGLNTDQAAATRAARQVVSKIAKLKVDRRAGVSPGDHSVLSIFYCMVCVNGSRLGGKGSSFYWGH